MIREVLFAALIAIGFGSPIGESNARVSSGGRPALPGEIPYQVSLRTLANVHVCSGAILNNRWVLTGAICTFGRGPNTLSAIVGTHLLNSGGIAYTSNNIITHPQFNIDLFLNEIGLVQTQVTITLTIDVQYRPMGSAFFAPGYNALSSGWGWNNLNELHVLVLTSITNADCISRLPEFSSVIYDHTLCVLSAPGNSICEEGNPLVANGQIHGVSAWDAQCDGSTPSMHERIFHFRSWIESIIS